jgi:REP-associated tyrosine transposase
LEEPTARQLRIEYPGAFYHITSRGNQKQLIALSDRDRFTFLRILREACEKFGAVIHAYCLMSNHYHLLLQTLNANLSNVMHFINTSYTHYFNWKNGKSGHLFQGRYTAILIDSEAYGLEVSRYSHLNPVRAKIVSQPEDYPWSSYREFAGSRTAPPWLDVKSILGRFGEDLGVSRRRYVEFVAEGIGKPLESPMKKAGPSLILGNDEFIARIKANFVGERKINREVPAIRAIRERPQLEVILRSATRVTGGNRRLSRDLAIYLCKRRTDYTLSEIANFFGIGKSAVSKAGCQIESALSQDMFLKEAYRELERLLFEIAPPLSPFHADDETPDGILSQKWKV